MRSAPRAPGSARSRPFLLDWSKSPLEAIAKPEPPPIAESIRQNLSPETRPETRLDGRLEPVAVGPAQAQVAGSQVPATSLQSRLPATESDSSRQGSAVRPLNCEVRIRPQPHNPHSVTTSRIVLTRVRLSQFYCERRTRRTCGRLALAHRSSHSRQWTASGLLSALPDSGTPALRRSPSSWCWWPGPVGRYEPSEQPFAA